MTRIILCVTYMQNLFQELYSNRSFEWKNDNRQLNSYSDRKVFWINFFVQIWIFNISQLIWNSEKVIVKRVSDFLF